MERLQELLKCVCGLKQPATWSHANERVGQEHALARRLASTPGVKVYGTNTLTGHRECEGLGSDRKTDIDKEIIRSHAILNREPYGDFECRCISYSRLYLLSAGHSGIDECVYRELQSICVDPKFLPSVPGDSSYSCGDVIPAAHWTKHAIDALAIAGVPTPPGTVMALMNGAFVQIGLAAASTRDLSLAFALLVETATIQSGLSGRASEYFRPSARKDTWAFRVIEHARQRARLGESDPAGQSPVSIRSIPQQLETLCSAIEDYLGEIDRLLGEPSGNPLFCTETGKALSQASFLCPTLSVRTGALTESLLFCAWAVVQRTKAVLGGKFGIPIDGGTGDTPLGLIQVPKLMMAKLESARARHGTRIFSSGGQTSYGMEDLWTKGLQQVEALRDLCSTVSELCLLEAHVLSYIGTTFDARIIDSALMANIGERSSIDHSVCLLQDKILPDLLADSLELFPVMACRAGAFA